MSEKRTEIYLGTILKDFPKHNIYYNPSENETLKEIFKNASKNGNNQGIPDRIYYNKLDHILIIFECKYDNMNKAILDLKKYKNKIRKSEHLNQYYIAVVNNNYNIYDIDFNIIDKKMQPTTFNIDINDSINIYNIQNMYKDIHNIHNYIRDYTKISNEDKCFFIACILISLKKESFIIIIENYDSNEYLYDIMKQNLIEVGIDFSVFDFLRNDENNIHFLNIINMVKIIYKENITNDLLNIFYNEFVKYNNTDSKSLGIVLTPDHIVKLMIELLDINNTDIFLDLCCDTGSFSLDVIKKNPKQIINCEYQNKLFTLMKCNMILRDIDLENNKLIKDNCFNQTFKATKSAINPPYGMKDKKELDFVIKQLDSICDGGLICAIIPCSNFKKSNNRDILFEKSTVIKIIKCNENLFYPNAGVKTCIVLLKKKVQKIPKPYNILLDNYENDGFEIKRSNGRIKTNNGNYISDIIEISYKDLCWLNYTVHKKININNLKKKILEIEYHNNLLSLDHINKICEDNIYFKTFKISDLFHIIKKPRTVYKNIGINVFEISAKNNNNGIKGYCSSNKNTFTGNKIVLITGGNGGAGLAFYQEMDFNISSATTVLEPKNDKIILNKKIGIYVAEELSKYKQNYSRGITWNLARINQDTIDIPTNDNKINYNYIESLFDIK